MAKRLGAGLRTVNQVRGTIINRHYTLVARSHILFGVLCDLEIGRFHIKVQILVPL